MSNLAASRRDLAVVTLGLAATSCAAAAVTGLWLAAPARSLLAVHFQAIPRTAGTATAIWLHNAKQLLGVAVFAVAQPAARALLDGARPRWQHLALFGCDILIGGWAIGSSLAAGVLVGAYGSRQLRNFVPYAPVEITAWLLLVVLYLDLRRGRAGLRDAAARLGLVAALLALAAVLELWAGS